MEALPTRSGFGVVTRLAVRTSTAWRGSVTRKLIEGLHRRALRAVAHSGWKAPAFPDRPTLLRGFALAMSPIANGVTVLAIRAVAISASRRSRKGVEILEFPAVRAALGDWQV